MVARSLSRFSFRSFTHLSSPAYLLDQFASPDWAFSTLLRLCAVSFLIGTAELVAKRDLFGLRGCLSWRIVGEFYSVRGLKPLNPAFAAQGTLSILILRLAASAGILLSARHAVLMTSALILALSSLLFNLRMPVGRDGSDQMNVLIIGPACMAMLCNRHVAYTSVLLFVAAQASLAYTTSGVAKLISPVWRSGDALPQILSTLSYGNQRAAQFLHSHHVLSLILSWVVISFEAGFLLAFLIGPRATLVMLLFGAVFHLSCAVLMGLNCFLWSFVATYPAILFSSLYVRSLWFHASA